MHPATTLPVDEATNADNRGRHALMLAQANGLISHFLCPYDLGDPAQREALQEVLGPAAQLPADSGTYDLVYLTARDTKETYPVLVPEEHAHAYAQAWAMARSPQLAAELQYRPGVLPTGA